MIKLNINRNFLFFSIIALSFSKQLSADQKSKPIAINSHIHVMNYSPNEVHRYTGFYNYAADILFEEGEKISTLAIGDPTAWQITPAGNRLYIKPIQDNPETNALIITNRRVYHFILDAKEATGLDDPNLVFETRFVYPQINFLTNSFQESYIPDINDDVNLNFNYKLSGSDRIKPIRVFDDGRFTYMQFPEANVNFPAIFDVDEKGNEGIVNVRTVGKHLVVEKVGSVFTLRYNDEHVCAFNENRPHVIKRSKLEKILANEKKRKKDEIRERHVQMVKDHKEKRNSHKIS